jgi:GINS complex subunit 1
MFCTKSFELIKQLDSNLSQAHELSAFNEDNVRYTFEECRTLFAQNQIDVQPVLKGDNSNLPTIQMRHAALQRNKRNLLTYVYTRMNWIAGLRFELATATAPKHIRSNMSDLEVSWFQKYSKTLANYMKALSQSTQSSESSSNLYAIDLTQFTRPPKSLYIHVRCLTDYGDFELSDGHAVSLSKNSQHYLLATDVQDLVKQGILEHLD